jgi:hypothetical protein
VAIIYDMLELDGLPGVGDVVGVPGIGADVEFLMSETTAEVPDDYFSSALSQVIEAGFHIGSLGTFPAQIDGTSYSTNGLYEAKIDIGGTGYSAFIVQAIPVGGGTERYFLIPEDGVSPLDITSVTIQSMTSVVFVDADDAATDDTINLVVCFAAGTCLATPAGATPVEDLTAGDLVTTRDDGDQPVLWTAETVVPLCEAQQDSRLNLIEVDPGAFAEAMPFRRLRVSRHHRLLLKSRIAERMFGTDEVLIAAKNLVGFPGIRAARADRDIRYHHVLLPRHSVLQAEGVWAESLWLGEQAARMLGAEAVLQARRMLYAQQEPARPFVSGQRARKLLARHRQNRRPIWAAPQCPSEGGRNPGFCDLAVEPA